MTEQVIDQVSSVGATWPPAEASHDRMRGFYEEALRSEHDVEIFVASFNEHQTNTAETQGRSRLSVRAVADANSIALLDRMSIPLEGALPIRKHDGLAVVYTAWNNKDRQVSDTQLDAHCTLLANTVKHDYSTSKAKRLIASGLTCRIIDQHTPEPQKERMVNQFIDLYSVFGYNSKDVEDIIMNPANTIVYAEDKEGVISSAMSEQATLSIQGYGDLRIAEITEAITRPNMRGRGYYAAVSGYLTEILRTKDEPLDIIYGESNLAMEGVLRAAHENGRRFSVFDSERFRIRQPGFGILQQNFRVVDGAEQRPFNDFALSYVPVG